MNSKKEINDQPTIKIPYKATAQQQHKHIIQTKSVVHIEIKMTQFKTIKTNEIFVFFFFFHIILDPTTRLKRRRNNKNQKRKQNAPHHCPMWRKTWRFLIVRSVQ